MWTNWILLVCVLSLSAMLMHVSNLLVDFVAAAAHVHCINHKDYQKCKTDFLSGTQKAMNKD